MMVHAVVYDVATGEIQSAVKMPEESLPDFAAALPEAWEVLPDAPPDAHDGTHWVNGAGTLVAYTEAQRNLKAARPRHPCTWRNDLMAWQDNRTLLEAQDARWEVIKAARDAAIDAGFVCDGRAYDSDEVSRANINGAATAAMIAQGAGAPFSVDWTLADNSVATLDAGQMIAVGLALMAHVDAQYAAARPLREAIYAAPTVAAVEAVAWPG